MKKKLNFDVHASPWRTIWRYAGQTNGKEWTSFGGDAIKVDWEWIWIRNKVYILILINLMDFSKNQVIREIVSSASRNFRTRSYRNGSTLFMQQTIIFSIIDL